MTADLGQNLNLPAPSIQPFPAFRLAAIGDGLIGPLSRSGRAEAGLERLFIENRFINWLNVILPGAEIPEKFVYGVPGETTVAVAKRVHAILELDPRPQAVLICVGTVDCMASIRGIAPKPEATVDALETTAAELLGAGIQPIFIIQPPCELFSNGLFADRFVFIAATLRRIAEQDTRIGLIDPTNALDEAAFLWHRARSAVCHKLCGWQPEQSGGVLSRDRGSK